MLSWSFKGDELKIDGKMGNEELISVDKLIESDLTSTIALKLIVNKTKLVGDEGTVDS